MVMNNLSCSFIFQGYLLTNNLSSQALLYPLLLPYSLDTDICDSHSCRVFQHRQIFYFHKLFIELNPNRCTQHLFQNIYFNVKAACFTATSNGSWGRNPQVQFYSFLASKVSFWFKRKAYKGSLVKGISSKERWRPWRKLFKAKTIDDPSFWYLLCQRCSCKTAGSWGRSQGSYSAKESRTGNEMC